MSCQQSEPVICTHFCCCLVTKSCPTLWRSHRLQPTRLICPWDCPASPLFWLSSYLGHHRALSSVPCAAREVLISYLFYTQQCINVNPSLSVHPNPSSLHKLVLLHLCLYFCFASKFICTIFLDFTYKQYYMISVFLFLIFFTPYDNLQIYPCLQMVLFHSYIYDIYICTYIYFKCSYSDVLLKWILSLSSTLLMDLFLL